jgi:hypothetical protein
MVTPNDGIQNPGTHGTEFYVMANPGRIFHKPHIALGATAIDNTGTNPGLFLKALHPFFAGFPIQESREYLDSGRQVTLR